MNYECVMVGTSLRLIPAVVSYTWRFVYVLSSAVARGGAISPAPVTRFPFPIYSCLCHLSVSVCLLVLRLTLHMESTPLFDPFYCVKDPQARIN